MLKVGTDLPDYIYNITFQKIVIFTVAIVRTQDLAFIPLPKKEVFHHSSYFWTDSLAARIGEQS
jgi:hypothetical protein